MVNRFYLDKRVLVNGKESQIRLDNFLNLHDYIVQVVNGSIGGIPPYVFQNGLNESSAVVEWGGTLLRNTVIDGSGFNTTFENGKIFTVTTVPGYNIEAGISTGLNFATGSNCALYRNWASDKTAYHVINEKVGESFAVSGFKYIDSLTNDSVEAITSHGENSLSQRFTQRDDALNSVNLTFINHEVNLLEIGHDFDNGSLSEKILISANDLKGIGFSGDDGVVTYEYYFPANNGNPGDVLTEDGVGNLSWTAPPGATVTGADNGLTINSTIVQLGGPLVQSTNIDAGSSYDLSFTNIVEFQVTATDNIILSSASDLLINSQTLTLNSDTLQIDTNQPNVEVGDILEITNSVTKEVQFVRQTKELTFTCFGYNDLVALGSNDGFITIPQSLDGWVLKEVTASYPQGSGTINFQLQKNVAPLIVLSLITNVQTFSLTPTTVNVGDVITTSVITKVGNPTGFQITLILQNA
jgi:hypothetical protein